MSFIHEVKAAQSSDFHEEVKALYEKRGKEKIIEKRDFLKAVGDAAERISEMKEDILKVAKNGGHHYVVIENFAWIQPPFFKSSVDFADVPLSSVKLLTGEINCGDNDPQWRSTYKKFRRDTIESKEFLNLWDALETLGLEPYFERKYYGQEFRFCVKF